MPTQPLDLSYPAILNLFGDFTAKGRTESQALLAWFLENYYRLDATEVDDAICDEPGDKGIDGIYLSEINQQIDILQSKVGKNNERQLGDAGVSPLVGILAQFRDAESVRHLYATTSSENLKKLLDRLEIERHIDEGYAIRAVLVTNKLADGSAHDYIRGSENIEVYDKARLSKQYVPLDKPSPIAGPIKFTVSDVTVLHHIIEEGVDMIIAPILASELIQMDGLSSQELFAWNLRYSLQRSPINKAIDDSVKTATEHKYFPAFHNGLTVLAQDLDGDKDSIEIKNYAVVNGCQSLTSLYRNSASITPELRILTKFVSVPPDGPLAQKITDHTNRQNAISGRDRQSNNPIQTRLQTEVANEYGDSAFYRIARGERPDWNSDKVIENDAIARTLLAFDVKQPQNCHQTYRLFDDLHSEIFGRKEVDAHRLVALNEIDNLVREILPTMEDKQFSGYSLTPFLVTYLLREILESQETDGRKFIESPRDYTKAKYGRRRIKAAMTGIVTAIVRSLKPAIDLIRQQQPSFDYKKDLKSEARVNEIKNTLLIFFQMATQSSLVQPFPVAWEESVNAIPELSK